MKSSEKNLTSFCRFARLFFALKRRSSGAWQDAAGAPFRYYMVFQSKDLKLDGAVQFDKFVELLKDL